MAKSNNFHFEHLLNPTEGFSAVFIGEADGKPAELALIRSNGSELFYPGTFEDCRRLFAEMSGQPIEEQNWLIVYP